MKGIKEKIISAFFLIISILVISGTFFVILNFVLIKNYERIMENLLSQYQIIEKTQSVTESFRNITNYYNDSRVSEFENITEDLENHLVRVDNSIEDKENFATYFGLRSTVTSLIKDAKIGVNLAEEKKLINSGLYLENVQEKNRFVKDTTGILILAEIETLESIQDDIYKTRKLIETTATFVFVIVILFSIFYALRFSDKLINPLYKLTQKAKLVKNGDLNINVNEKEFKEYQEIYTLSSSFETMVKSLKDSIYKLNQYLDVSGIFVMTFDFNNRITDLNKKALEILGLNSKQQFLEKNWIEEFVVEEDKNKTKSLIDNLKTSAAHEDHMENSVVSENNKKRDIVWRFRLLYDSNKKVKSILAAGLDITELSQAKSTINKLKELDDLKNEILNIATHELKTPLISIVGLSEVIKNDPKNINKEYLEFINIINSEGQKLNHLIKSMLTVNRNDMGKVVVNKSEIDLKEFKKELKSSLEMLTKRSESKLKIIDKTELQRIETDKERVSQIIYNFVDNAVKYGPEGQTVSVIFEKEDDNNLKISVKDEGKGVSKEKQKKLFKKFSQLEPSLSRSQDGMGLGLYISKQNVEALNGKIGIESKKDKGSTFYIILPINNK
ncbi:MAG: PAS domain-containing sensor histidine kinase [Patescibacteria group bacterium]|jgi:PAS domain S-box-containing protein|nr:PAS domain-containing sensor histidine kinase [Patescibacteria group bacterium]